MKIFNIITISLILLASCSPKIQTRTVFYDKNDNETTKDSAIYYLIIKKDSSNKRKTLVLRYTKNDTLETATQYSTYEKKEKIKDGYKKYFEKTLLDEVGYYKKNKLHGNLVQYYPDGSIKREEEFSKGKSLKSKCYDKDGNSIKCLVYRRMPFYKGGDSARRIFIVKNLVYPPLDIENQVTGKVYVKFIIHKDGSLSKVHAVKSPSQLMSEESVRVTKLMTDWQPGIERGKYINVWVVMPISFKLY